MVYTAFKDGYKRETTYGELAGVDLTALVTVLVSKVRELSKEVDRLKNDNN